ncbi:hypothetical protein DSBG_1547 [Desulfosporosinus sp. BG]|nr:hypothetical protein DSBG_1547 [Desulfosporosinus sp. BG]
MGNYLEHGFIIANIPSGGLLRQTSRFSFYRSPNIYSVDHRMPGVGQIRQQ